MEPIVELAAGRVAGSSEGPLSVFRGVPFARPPVGLLRFGAPQAPEPWTGVRDASAFASAEALATTMQDAWLAFARTGDPGWPAYDPTTRATMLLGEQCAVVDDRLAAERLAWDGLPTA